MTIRGDIAAVMADNTLTVPQKRRQVRRIRAQAMRNSMPALPFTFTPGPLTITVESAHFDPATDALEVVLTASVTATGAPIVLDNPFRFINPPILVPDAASLDVVRNSSRPDGTPVTESFREDALAALRSIIVDAVKAQAK